MASHYREKWYQTNKRYLHMVVFMSIKQDAIAPPADSIQWLGSLAALNSKSAH